MKKRLLFPLVMLFLTPCVLALCLLAGPSGSVIPDWRTDTGHAILMIRMSRVVAAFFVGAALACAGAILQSVLRNPLAEPYVLGVSSGAGLGAALAIVSGFASSTLLALPVTAFSCAVATLALVYWISGVGSRNSVYGLILSGVIVSSVCSSILMSIVALAPVEGMHGIMWWMLGSLDIQSDELLLVVCVLIAMGIAFSWTLSPELNALSLGSEMAHHVGVRTKLAIGLALLAATLLTAAAVALAGLIGFVGLVVPHAVRSFTGQNHRTLIPAAALSGGVFLAVCDAIARTALSRRGVPEIPVGVITALVGGPFFLWILLRRRRRGWLE